MISQAHISRSQLSARDFTRLSRFIQTRLGIKMPRSKHTMLQSRLAKRLRALDMRDFSEYCDYLFSDKGLDREIVHMVDAVTTNKTEFFRERNTLDRLAGLAVPSLLEERGEARGSALRVWSAGCSTGEEVYSLAMVLEESPFGQKGRSFSILGTDVSSRVLSIARQGIYSEDAARTVPWEIRRKYFMRSKDSRRGLVRVVPEIRAKAGFRHFNLMEPFDFARPMHVIFCRNVLIYFDRPTQERMIEKFYRMLLPGGFLFLGHSETMPNLSLPLMQIAPLTYKRVT